jgi:hypothetical protein
MAKKIGPATQPRYEKANGKPSTPAPTTAVTEWHVACGHVAAVQAEFQSASRIKENGKPTTPAPTTAVTVCIRIGKVTTINLHFPGISPTNF